MPAVETRGEEAIIERRTFLGLFFTIMVPGIFLNSCATMPSATPADFVGNWTGDWYSNTGPGRGPMTLSVGPERNERYAVDATFTNAPFPGMSGEARFVNGRLELKQGDLTVTINRTGKDKLSAEWYYGRSNGGWSLDRKS